MEIRRKAVNLICKFYEFDASKIASAIAAEQAEDNAALVDLLDGMIAELQSLVSGLNPPEPERRIRKTVPEPREKKPLGRRPNPDRAAQKRLDYIAKRRSQLRKDGYHIAKNSMVAYWDEKTNRRKKTEESNIFGFIFRKKDEKSFGG